MVRRDIRSNVRSVCMLYIVHAITNEQDFLAQKPWLTETIEQYPIYFLCFYPKFHCELVWGGLSLIIVITAITTTKTLSVDTYDTR